MNIEIGKPTNDGHTMQFYLEKMFGSDAIGLWSYTPDGGTKLELTIDRYGGYEISPDARLTNNQPTK